jgi:hypothetical protein
VKPHHTASRLPLEQRLDLYDARALSEETLRRGRRMSRHAIARFLRERDMARLDRSQPTIPASKAAELLSISGSELHRWIVQGRIPARKLRARRRPRRRLFVYAVPMGAFLELAARLEGQRRLEEEEGLAAHLAEVIEHVRIKYGEGEAEKLRARIATEREAAKR